MSVIIARGQWQFYNCLFIIFRYSRFNEQELYIQFFFLIVFPSPCKMALCRVLARYRLLTCHNHLNRSIFPRHYKLYFNSIRGDATRSQAVKAYGRSSDQRSGSDNFANGRTKFSLVILSALVAEKLYSKFSIRAVCEQDETNEKVSFRIHFPKNDESERNMRKVKNHESYHLILYIY